MWQDLTLALRAIRARPGFSIIVLATLALGIGANTAIFSVVDAVVLRPLPYRDPQRLYFIFPTNPKDSGKDRLARMAEVDIMKRQLQSFDDLAVATKVWESFVTTDSGESIAIQGITASANLIDVLGVKPALGRAFLPEEDVEGGPRVAMLTHASWLRRYGGNPAIVDRNIILRGRATRIVGVLPAGVSFPDPSSELWLPARQSSGVRRWRVLNIVGRLKQGAAEPAARAELATVARRLEAEFPDVNAGMGLRLVGLHQELTSQTRPTLLLLLCAVGLVLLIACVNVANLMLARGLSRSGEIAVRVALGASRARIIRQLMTEGLLLALAGGALGALLARWGVELALSRSPIPVADHHQVALDARVLAFTLVISVLTGACFSLVPAWRMLRLNPQLALRAQGRGATGGPNRRLSNTLVIAEMAVALILLVGAGLLMRTFGRLLAVDPGFDAQNLLTFLISLPGEPDPNRQLLLNRQVEEQLKGLPGVSVVGQISRLPFANLPNVLEALEIQDRPVPAGQRPAIDVRYATADYFRAMAIPLLRGRLVNEFDKHLVVINEAAARRFWPNENPIGKQVRTAGSADPPTEWHTIVGLVGSVRHLALDEPPRAEVYFYAPTEQRGQFVVRTNSHPSSLIPAVRAAILQVDRRFGITAVEAMDGLVLRSVATRRFGMLLLGGFAGLALVLAAIGLYGVMSYAVAERRREIGVRMALGAQERDVSRMVIREGMALVLLGAGIGLVAALALTRLISPLLYGISAFDPLTLTVVPALLATVALLAAYLAARRAIKVDPMITLREG